MKGLTGPLLAAALLLPLSAVAQEATVTANAGWSSEYLYRGIPQESSSASGPGWTSHWLACTSESGALT